LDDTHLMRMAGRFARRVKAWAGANGVPVIYCTAGQRKHRVAEEHVAACPPPGPGVFLVLAAKAPATAWKVKRSSRGNIISIEKKTEYVYHYSFHIMDPEWGMSRSRCPDLRPVDLLGLPVLRPGPRWAGAQRVPLWLLGLPGRIQPQPAVRLRRHDGGAVRAGLRPDPLPARHPGAAQAVRPLRTATS